MIYRDTVISATGHSPTQLLIGRHVKTNLPTPSSALRSCQSSPEDIRENDNKAKLSCTQHYDRRHSARSLPSLSPGDEVRVKTPHNRVTGHRKVWCRLQLIRHGRSWCRHHPAESTAGTDVTCKRQASPPSRPSMSSRVSQR